MSLKKVKEVDFKPFDESWNKEMMKLNKQRLVQMLEESFKAKIQLENVLRNLGYNPHNL